MITTVNNTDDQRQLIPALSVLPEKDLNDDRIMVIDEINNNLDTQTSTEVKQQTFLLRSCSWIIKIITSLRLPHFSDNTLRIIFLTFITLIGCTSFTIALIVGSSIVQFKQQCPLYATFEFQIFITNERNWTIKIIPLTEKFSSQSTCDYCTFYNVFTFIYCIMTGFFFVLFNGDQRIITTNDRCLIIPWFPISIILGLFSLTNACVLTNGFLKFCTNIIAHDNHINSCAQLNHLFFEQYPSVSSFFSYMLLAIISSWFQLAFFIGIITVLTIRLGSSFDWSNKDDNKINGKSMNILLQSMEQT